MIVFIGVQIRGYNLLIDVLEVNKGYRRYSTSRGQSMVSERVQGKENH